ncbi:GL18857 [Drosophila persimilis]|uniref:Protein arginine N-methyltransferase 6 n=2 Tax=Drosophila persimilis TaxID=7234 RepID=B4G8D7_DROPE|nr:GL18857 [Drosophila persimilis]
MRINKKNKKNVETKANGAIKKAPQPGLGDFHHHVDNNDKVHAELQLKSPCQALERELGVMCESKTASSSRGCGANDREQKISSGMPRATQVPPKPLGQLSTPEFNGHNISKKVPESVEAGSVRKMYGNRNRKKPKDPCDVSQRATPEMNCHEVPYVHNIYSEISELYPKPSGQSVRFVPQRRDGGSTGKTRREEEDNFNGIDQKPLNTWEKALAAMYGHGNSDDHIYRGVSELFPEPSTQSQSSPFVPLRVANNYKQISRVEGEPSKARIPCVQARKEPQIKIMKRPEPDKVTFTIKNEPIRGLPRGKVRVQSCHPKAPPARCVPKELEQVDRMTSADFRHDNNAHMLNMRTQLKNQDHMHYFAMVIRENAHLFKGRVILVLSCGVGTLALMAARIGGAKRVYAVDHSMVTNYAELVVKQNHFEHTVKVLHGRIADLKLPEKVDGIVCNWMGHSLLWNSEILEVLEARDRWLKKNGFILPDLGALYLVGAAEPELKGLCDWWRSVYYFKMNAMRRCALSEPRYAKTHADCVLTLAHRVLALNLKRATPEDLQIDRDIRLKVTKDGHLECFTLYFDVAFSQCHRQRTLSCNPCLSSGYNSLWLQTVLFVERSFVLRENLHYAGRFIFRPLERFDTNQFEIVIKLSESRRFEGEMPGFFGNRLVSKRWLMMDRHQTVAEVDSCQDEDN